MPSALLRMYHYAEITQKLSRTKPIMANKSTKKLQNFYVINILCS